MEQRVSLVTLGVADVARARRFYEALATTGRSALLRRPRRPHPKRALGRCAPDNQRDGRPFVSILWIILIVVLVLALLGFFGRGRF